MVAQLLIAASAAIVFVLGAIHLVYTFGSRKFCPRDPVLEDHMQRVSPVLTRQTTMWRAWVGFNASHSLGAMLFGAVYGYLALAHGDLLRQSRFLCVLGALFLGTFVVLAKRYWFNIPFAALVAASCSYLAGAIASLT